jgi:peptide/nickel transport system permease protein
MSSITSPTHVTEPGAIHRSPPRSFWEQAFRTALGRTSARMGLGWIGVIVFFTVFAPLIANSHPLLMKVDGRWSSPMLQHLEPSDVAIFVVFLASLIVFPLRFIGLRCRFAIVGFIAVVAIGLCAALIHPPQAVVYEQYRLMERDGKVQWIMRAPIPFSPRDRMRDQPRTAAFAPWWSAPSGSEDRAAHRWLGTTDDMSDVASRMIHASRIALAIGFISTSIAMFIGVLIGGLMGYFGGIVDLAGMRLVEIFEFIPTLFLLLMFVAFFPGNPRPFGIEVQRIYFIMAIIGLTSWSGYARFIRAEFFRLRKQDFVQAAIATGLPLRSILFRHMLPNGLTPVLIRASFGVAGAIVAEATLSFLGLGLVDEPSWGQLLNKATGATGAFTWWIAIFPGLAIFLTVFAYNLVGEALRDAIDPHLRKSAQL